MKGCVQWNRLQESEDWFELSFLHKFLGIFFSVFFFFFFFFFACRISVLNPCLRCINTLACSFALLQRRRRSSSKYSG